MTMVKVKTAELTGLALDWSVAKATGINAEISYKHDPENHNEEPCEIFDNDTVDAFSPSTDWSQGGPLIDEHDVWLSDYDGACVASCEPHFGRFIQEGNTNLIAICRAVVATKLGEEVEVPQELVS